MVNVPRERDPNLIKLEDEVAKKMNAAVSKPELKAKKQPHSDISHVSFEDALRELSALEGLESLDDES